MPKNLTLRHRQKIEDKEKFLKEARGKKNFARRATKIILYPTSQNPRKQEERGVKYLGCLGKKTHILNFVPREIVLQKGRRNEDFLRQTKN